MTKPTGNIWRGDKIPPASKVDRHGDIRPQTAEEARERWMRFAAEMREAGANKEKAIE